MNMEQQLFYIKFQKGFFSSSMLELTMLELTL